MEGNPIICGGAGRKPGSDKWNWSFCFVVRTKAEEWSVGLIVFSVLMVLVEIDKEFPQELHRERRMENEEEQSVIDSEMLWRSWQGMGWQ